MKIKKILSVAALAGVGAVALASCGKNTKEIQISIPSDGTNQCRALKLLEAAGLIELDPAAGYSPELKDITKYVYNIKVVPQAADTLANTLSDYCASCINGTYASTAGLVPSKDGIIIEKQDGSGENPYVNIIAVRTEDKDNADYKKIADAYHTQIVAEYLIGKYEESFFPAFTYEAKTADAYSQTVKTVDDYASSTKNKTYSKKVTIGVCGARNDYWKAVQYVLDEQNADIKIELKIFSAFNLPNSALNSKEVDLNSFQHKAYLNSEVSAKNYKIESLADTLIAPLTLYSKTYSSLDALKEAAGLKNN